MFLDPINLGNWAWWIKKYSAPALLYLLSLHCGDNHSVGVAEYLIGGDGDRGGCRGVGRGGGGGRGRG